LEFNKKRRREEIGQSQAVVVEVKEFEFQKQWFPHWRCGGQAVFNGRSTDRGSLAFFIWKMGRKSLIEF